MESKEKRCRTVKAKFGPIHINLNPVVALTSAIVIWGFVLWCILDTDRASDKMKDAKRWITDKFTWLYIGAQAVWFIFLLIIYFSKYGKMKLGKDDDEPEFSNATYFTMLFSAGISNGLFYYSVAEPVYHYAPKKPYNRYWGRYSDNQRAQDAINITLFNWGFHGWIVYSIVGIVIGIVVYKKDLPMTIRSCFHPLLGGRIFGWMGEVIDILSVIVTMFGVCTSFGLGVITINSGLNRINSDIEENSTNQMIIIWVITAIAIISVISGPKVGIRRLSELCFCMGTGLMMFVLFCDNTWFLLNLYVQSIGYHIQWLIQLGFHTDAFAQLGKAPDGKGDPTWMENWTIFYWGWWIAWSAFIGMFIARVSRGRTIKNLINATMTAPILYSFLWLCIFGGVGIRMEREAELNNITCNSTYGGRLSRESYKGLFRLSCREYSQTFFDVLQQYGENIKNFLFGLSLATMSQYFITSTDRGALVIDCLSSNGNTEAPITQRIFWALTVGACSTALLKAGGEDALTALQTVCIAGGLIYVVIVCFMCVALWQALEDKAADADRNDPHFYNSIFAVLDFNSARKWWNVFIATFAPWWPAGQAAGKVYSQKSWPHMVVIAMFFYGWIALEISEIAEDGLAYIGWVVLCGFFAYVTGIRIAIRDKGAIKGSMFEDALAVLFLYPLAIDQMHDHISLEDARRNKDHVDDIGLENIGQGTCLEKNQNNIEQHHF